MARKWNLELRPFAIPLYFRFSLLFAFCFFVCVVLFYLRFLFFYLRFLFFICVFYFFLFAFSFLFVFEPSGPPYNKIQNCSKIALSKGIGKGYGIMFLVRPHKRYKHRLNCNQC